MIQLLSSPAVLWGMCAAVPAVTAEFLYKVWPVGWPWWWGLPAWAPIQLAIGYSVFRLVTIPNSNLLDAFIVFAFSTTALRVFVSVVVLNQDVRGGTWFALVLLIMARIAQTFWGR